jgi:outer membrane protein OmpA-like peptidoglycan-associated protein
MKLLCRKFAVFFLVAFLWNSVFAQGKEIKELFNASTRSVEVGDSCFLRQPFGLSFGSLLTPELASACDSIYAFLKQNPSISIAIIVHTDFDQVQSGIKLFTIGL